MRPTVLCTIFLASLAQAGAAAAALQTFASDADFTQDFVTGQGFVKVGGGNVRWGNGGPAGDWEYAVVNGVDAPLAQGQVEWGVLPGYAAGSATVANTGFTYSFTAGGTQTLALTDVNGVAIGSDTDPGSAGVQRAASASVAVPANGINTLVVRTRAASGDVAVVGPGGSGAGIRVTFDSGGFFDIGRVAGDADAEYAVLVDARLAGGFSIADDATLRDGSGSLPMWQFKVGLTPIPAPDSLVLALGGAGCLVLLLGRRSHRSTAGSPRHAQAHLAR